MKIRINEKNHNSNSKVTGKRKLDWNIVNSQPIGHNTYLYYFTSKNYDLKNWLPGTRWMGRSFIVRFKGKS